MSQSNVQWAAQPCPERGHSHALEGSHGIGFGSFHEMGNATIGSTYGE